MKKIIYIILSRFLNQISTVLQYLIVIRELETNIQNSFAIAYSLFFIFSTFLDYGYRHTIFRLSSCSYSDYNKLNLVFNISKRYFLNFTLILPISISVFYFYSGLEGYNVIYCSLCLLFFPASDIWGSFHIGSGNSYVVIISSIISLLLLIFMIYFAHINPIISLSFSFFSRFIFNICSIFLLSSYVNKMDISVLDRNEFFDSFSVLGIISNALIWRLPLILAPLTHSAEGEIASISTLLMVSQKIELLSSTKAIAGIQTNTSSIMTLIKSKYSYFAIIITIFTILLFNNFINDNTLNLEKVSNLLLLPIIISTPIIYITQFIRWNVLMNGVQIILIKYQAISLLISITLVIFCFIILGEFHLLTLLWIYSFGVLFFFLFSLKYFLKMEQKCQSKE